MGVPGDSIPQSGLDRVTAGSKSGAICVAFRPRQLSQRRSPGPERWQCWWAHRPCMGCAGSHRGGRWSTLCTAVFPGVGRQRGEARWSKRDVSVRRRQSSPHRFLSSDAPCASGGMSAHAHADGQPHVCGPCQYRLVRWCYFSLIWFLSNPPEVEISQQSHLLHSKAGADEKTSLLFLP